MQYHVWIEFRKQRAAGVSGTLAALLQDYQNWPQRPTHWNSFRDFDKIDNGKVIQLTDWQPNVGGIIQIPIQPPAMRQELLEAIEHFGAVLQSARNIAVPPLQGSARGSVIYDVARNRLYYAVSRYVANMNVHQTLVNRQQQILGIPGQINGSLSEWPTFVCAEFRALNKALLDGAREDDLEVWTFRARDMQPTLRCPNCCVTLPWNVLGRIWTC
jgi:hypothetical protein